jgi:hypothetical protein
MNPLDDLDRRLRTEAARQGLDARVPLQLRILKAVQRAGPPAPGGRTLDAPFAPPAPRQRWLLAASLAGAGALLAAGLVLAVGLEPTPAAAIRPPSEVNARASGVSTGELLPAPSFEPVALPAGEPLHEELDALSSDLALGGTYLIGALPPAPRHS